MSDIKYVDPIFKRARRILGEPIRTVELTDGQMRELLEHARELFFLLVAGEETSRGEAFYKTWVNQYFIALCKESLGRIRGKFGGKLPIPGTELMIDYKELLRESNNEKQFLKYLILQDDNLLSEQHKPVLVFYIGVRNIDAIEAEEHMRRIREEMDADDGFTKYFVPVRESDSRIECVYPTGGVSKELNNLIIDMKDKLGSLTQNGGIVGETFSIDFGGIGPSLCEVVVLTDSKIGLKKTVNNQHIELTREEFETMSGVKIEDYEK